MLGGSSSSNKSGEKTQNSRGSSDYWIVKLDSLRNIQSLYYPWLQNSYQLNRAKLVLKFNEINTERK